MAIDTYLVITTKIQLPPAYIEKYHNKVLPNTLMSMPQVANHYSNLIIKHLDNYEIPDEQKELSRMKSKVDVTIKNGV